jgi:hypothetical protein
MAHKNNKRPRSESGEDLSTTEMQEPLAKQPIISPACSVQEQHRKTKKCCIIKSGEDFGGEDTEELLNLFISLAQMNAGLQQDRNIITELISQLQEENEHLDAFESN